MRPGLGMGVQVLLVWGLLAWVWVPALKWLLLGALCRSVSPGEGDTSELQILNRYPLLEGM